MSTTNDIDESVAQRQLVLKAVSVGADDSQTDASNARDEDGGARLFEQAGAIEPPYDPRRLWAMYESSSALRQCVEAYTANIDGHGHHFEPIIDLEADDARDKVKHAMTIERMAAHARGQAVDVQMPTEEEVEKEIERLSWEMALEHFRLTSFFEECTSGMVSFPRLRAETREDLEVTGNGYLEVLRDGKNRISQFERLPAKSMRLLARDHCLTSVTVPRRTGPLSFGDTVKRHRFRRFVQVINNRCTYFKTFGDPRVMSHLTGKYYDNELKLTSAEADAVPATEVIHFKVNANGGYGVPRWVGATYAVLGTLKAEQVNYLYFENKGVPPMALLVSGASVSDASVKKIEDYIATNLKGVKNFHKMLIIQAEAQASSDPDQAPPGRIRIELKPLTQAQQSDALFQKYDERNADKVGQQFRLPRIVRGDVRDFNRGTADAALEFTEGQVFAPLRNDFDFTMSRMVLQNELRAKYFTFASNAIQLRDPEKVAEILSKLLTANALVPADARPIIEERVFYRKLRKLNGDWLYQPPMLTQTGMLPDNERDGEIPMATGPEPTTMQNRSMSKAEARNVVRSMLSIRAALEQQEAASELEALTAAKKTSGDNEAQPPRSDDGDAEVITMPLDELVRRFELKPTGT